MIDTNVTSVDQKNFSTNNSNFSKNTTNNLLKLVLNSECKYEISIEDLEKLNIKPQSFYTKSLTRWFENIPKCIYDLKEIINLNNENDINAVRQFLYKLDGLLENNKNFKNYNQYLAVVTFMNYYLNIIYDFEKMKKREINGDLISASYELCKISDDVHNFRTVEHPSADIQPLAGKYQFQGNKPLGVFESNFNQEASTLLFTTALTGVLGDVSEYSIPLFFASMMSFCQKYPNLEFHKFILNELVNNIENPILISKQLYYELPKYYYMTTNTSKLSHSNYIQNKYNTADAIADIEKFTSILNLDDRLYKYDKFKFFKEEYLKIIEKLTDSEKDKLFFIDFLNNYAFKFNGKWGTILDHLFLNFSFDDKVNLLNEIAKPETQLGFNSNNISHFENSAHDYYFQEFKYVSALLEYQQMCGKKIWHDRQISTKVLSHLILKILTQLKNKSDKLSILKIIENELIGERYSVFSDGRIANPSFGRNMLAGTLYTTDPIHTEVCNISGSDALIQSSTGIFTNGIGAIAFGLMTFTNHFKMPDNYKSKLNLVHEAISFVENLNENTEFINVETQEQVKETCNADHFLGQKIVDEEIFKFYENNESKSLEDFKIIMNNFLSEVNPERIKNFKLTLKNYVDFFKSHNCLKVVFEFNSGEKDCVLFNIVQKLFKPKNPIMPHEDVLFLNSIFKLIFEDKIIIQIDNICKNMNKTNFDKSVFEKFFSAGLKSASKSENPHELSLFCFQCHGLLEILKTDPRYSAHYAECFEVYVNALINSSDDFSSPLYMLQKRTSFAGTAWRMCIRFAACCLTSAIIFGLSTFGGLPIGILIAATLLLKGMDYAGRKYGERFAYSPNKRHFKVVTNLARSQFHFEDSSININDNLFHVSRSDILSNLNSLINNNFGEDINIDKLDSVNLDVLQDLRNKNYIEFMLNLKINMSEKEIKNLNDICNKYKGSRNISQIQVELENILNTSFDKKSSLRAILKTIYLVSSMEHMNIISENEKLDFFQKIQNNSTIKNYITKKALWSTWSGLFEFISIDFLIGIVINLSSLGLLFVTGFDTSPLYFILTVFFNYIGISAWMHFWDVQLHGNTKTNKFVNNYFEKLSEFQNKYDKISNSIKSRIEHQRRSMNEFELNFNVDN